MTPSGRLNRRLVGDRGGAGAQLHHADLLGPIPHLTIDQDLDVLYVARRTGELDPPGDFEL